MERRAVSVSLISTSPYSQTRNHRVPHLEGESEEEYEERTWREKIHFRNYTDEKGVPYQTVVIPASNLAHALAAAGKLLNPPVDTSGIRVVADLDLGIHPDRCRREIIYAHLDGNRESRERIVRYVPTFDEWDVVVDLVVTDSRITNSTLWELFELAGQIVGVGQFRPQNKGTNGCWAIEKIEWHGTRPAAPILGAEAR